LKTLKYGTFYGELKELAVLVPVYDLVRSVMVEPAKVQDVTSGRVSLVDVVRWLVVAEGRSVLRVDPVCEPGRTRSGEVRAEAMPTLFKSECGPPQGLAGQ